MVFNCCQSKHVRLITKCYPPRTASSPKPNSSELSYLTYYAYTTPSKLKKVGKFLEKKARESLAKGRTGDVIVTLDICTALIKKCFRDLGLFSSNIVAIMDAVVKNGELVLIERSVLTLKEFCSHHDGKLLTLSREYRACFLALCKGYARYGINQEDMRAQNASLDALSAFISSDAFHSPTAVTQIKTVVPALVLILAQSTVPLSSLKLKISENRLSPRERRQSFFTQEYGQGQAGTPRSSMQIDYTEEDNSVLALKNLRQVCEMNNASLLRIGLDCVMDKLALLSSSNSTEDYPAWTVELVTLILAWLPIQYRYLTVVASLDDLDSVPGPKRDKSISSSKQELILTIVEGILTTGESLIGLNVMDVLNTLIERIAIQINVRHDAAGDVVQKLVNCIVGLAGHIYYSDQIRDMCSAITEWARPLFIALKPISGKESPAVEGDEESLNVKSASIWSLRALKGVLQIGGGSVSLEEVWSGTGGALAGREGDVRMEYVDALVAHLRCKRTGEEGQDVQASVQFLTMIHVPIFYVLRSADSAASDYWATWVLLLVCLENFQLKEVLKALPMMWRVHDIAAEKLGQERRTCVEAVFLGFLAVVAETFHIEDLKAPLSKEIESRKGLHQWPAFIDPSINPSAVTLHGISSSLLVLPEPMHAPSPFPVDLSRANIVNALASSATISENFREHLLVQWSEGSSMPDRTVHVLSFLTEELLYNLEAPSGTHWGDRYRSGSTSAQSQSLEEQHPSHIHAQRARLLGRTPSPSIQIDQLRNVLANVTHPGVENVPRIEVNGTKVVLTGSNGTPDEKEQSDVTAILESLKVNDEWNEKRGGGVSDKANEGIQPPYGL